MNILRTGAASAVALLMLTVAPGPLMSVAAAQEATKVASGHTLAIQVNQGQLVRIDKPVESVFVANAEIADVAVKSPQLIYVFAKHPGTTTLYAVGANDEILASITLNVTHNLSRLDQAIADLMPGRNIAATSIDGGIVLTGMVSSPGEAEDARRLAARFIGQNEEIINRLQINAPVQVNVRVRIAEVNKNVLRNLGINWDAAIQEGGFAFGLMTTFPLGLSNVLGGSTARRRRWRRTDGPRRSARPDGDHGPAGPGRPGVAPGGTEPDGRVRPDRDVPGGRRVSDSRSSQSSSGAGSVPVVTIEFRQFGVSLGFTPTILNANRISMRVRPEVSALSDTGAVNANGFTIPSLTVRRAETTVELASGQTFAIAGLVQSTNQITANEVPGLGDIPVLGELFKSDKFQHNESELVILATPYVVQPISNPAAPAVPTDTTFGRRRLAAARRLFLHHSRLVRRLRPGRIRYRVRYAVMKTNNRTLRQAASVLALCLAPLAMSACTDHRLVTQATWKQQEAPAQPQVQRVDVQHVVPFAAKDLEISDVEREALAMFVRQNNLQPGSHVAVGRADEDGGPGGAVAQSSGLGPQRAAAPGHFQLDRAGAIDHQPEHRRRDRGVRADRGGAAARLPRLQPADHARLRVAAGHAPGLRQRRQPRAHGRQSERSRPGPAHRARRTPRRWRRASSATGRTRPIRRGDSRPAFPFRIATNQ